MSAYYLFGLQISGRMSNVIPFQPLGHSTISSFHQTTLSAKLVTSLIMVENFGLVCYCWRHSLLSDFTPLFFTLFN